MPVALHVATDYGSVEHVHRCEQVVVSSRPNTADLPPKKDRAGTIRTSRRPFDGDDPPTIGLPGSQ
jgi:hypothetical protein